MKFESIIAKPIGEIEGALQKLSKADVQTFLTRLEEFTIANIKVINGEEENYNGDLSGDSSALGDLNGVSNLSMLTDSDDGSSDNGSATKAASVASSVAKSSINEVAALSEAARNLILVVDIALLYAEKKVGTSSKGDRDKVTFKSEPLSNIITMLHDILFSLDESLELCVQLKKNISKACELWWVNEEMGCENVVTQLLPYLLLLSFSPYANESDIKRMVNIEKSLLLLDFEDESCESLIQLLLRCFINPLYLKCVEGRKFLAFTMTMHDCQLLDYIINIVKPQVALGNRNLCLAYGDVLLRAWRESNKDESTGKVSIIMIENCLQDLIYSAINAADRRYFKGLRLVLSCFNEVKRQKEVDNLIAKIYTPLIWRSLNCANGIARAQCTVLFFDVFPLQMFDNSNPHDNSSLLQRQFNTMVELLKDEDHRVRCASATGVSRVLREYWEAFPTQTIKSIMQELIYSLATDSSSVVVRVAAIKGFSDMLDQPLAVSTLAGALPLLRNSLHDKSDKVRLCLIELLLKVKEIRGIHFYDIVPIEHIFARLVEDVSNKQITLSLSNLLLNSFFPSGEGSAIQRYHRCLSFIGINSDAAYSFYRNLKSLVPLGTAVKFCSYIWTEIGCENLGLIRASYAAFTEGGDNVDNKENQLSNGIAMNSSNNSSNRSNNVGGGESNPIEDFFSSKTSIKSLLRMFWACLSTLVDDLLNPKNTASQAFFLTFVKLEDVEATFDALSCCHDAVEEIAIVMRLSNLLQLLGEPADKEGNPVKLSKQQAQSKYQSLTSKYYKWYSNLGNSKSSTFNGMHHEVITSIVAQTMLEYDGKDAALSSIEDFCSNMHNIGSSGGSNGTTSSERGGKRRSATENNAVSLLSANVSSSSYINITMSLLHKVVSEGKPNSGSSGGGTNASNTSKSSRAQQSNSNILGPRFFSKFSAFVGSCISDPSKCHLLSVQDSICKAFLSVLTHIILQASLPASAKSAKDRDSDIRLLQEVVAWISTVMFQEDEKSFGEFANNSKVALDDSSPMKSPSRSRRRDIKGLSDPSAHNFNNAKNSHTSSSMLLVTKLLCCSLVFMADALLVLDHALVINMKLPALYRSLCERLSGVIESQWDDVTDNDPNLGKSKQLILNKLFINC